MPGSVGIVSRRHSYTPGYQARSVRCVLLHTPQRPDGVS